MGFDGFFWVYICSCFGGWFSFAGCNQHFCNASVCRLFVYQKSQLWQPGGTPSPATPSLYRLPLVLVSIFNLIFPAAISLCLLWLRFFLTFNFLSFLPCFFFFFVFWCMTRRIWQTTGAPTQTNPEHRYVYILPPGYSHATNWGSTRAAHLSRVLRAQEIEVSKIVTPPIVPYDGSGLRRNAYGRD